MQTRPGFDADLYEIWCELAEIRSTAQLRGEFSAEQLTRLEDLGYALARIVEEELRFQSLPY